MTPALSFASAYRQLRPTERAFVDGYVADVEREAHRNHERISNALYRPIPAAVVAASRGMLERPMVCAAVTERITQIAADSELTVQRVLKELMSVAFTSMGHYGEVGEDGLFDFDLTKCTPEQLSAIKTIKIEESARGRKIEIALHDKLNAIEKLAKFMGMLENDNPHWRAETARPVGAGALSADMTVDAAADRYAAMING